MGPHAEGVVFSGDRKSGSIKVGRTCRSAVACSSPSCASGDQNPKMLTVEGSESGASQPCHKSSIPPQRTIRAAVTLQFMVRAPNSFAAAGPPRFPISRVKYCSAGKGFQKDTKRWACSSFDLFEVH
jgi:hypothetical protein